MAAIKKVVAKRPLVKKTVSKKPLVKAQKGISTAGQAYMKYVPGAQAKDTLGTDDTRFRHPGFAENTSNWQAKHKMLDMTYGEDTPAYTGERALQNKKDVKAYAKELKKAYPKEKTGGSTKSTYKSGGAVKPKAQLGAIVKAVGKGISTGAKVANKGIKAAKAEKFAKETSHLKRYEDWEKYNAAKPGKLAKKVVVGAAGVGTGYVAGKAAMNKKKK